jgi:hypothetical protein
MDDSSNDAKETDYDEMRSCNEDNTKEIKKENTYQEKLAYWDGALRSIA